MGHYLSSLYGLRKNYSAQDCDRDRKARRGKNCGKEGRGAAGERGNGIKAANVHGRQCGERQREIDDKPLTCFMN